MKTIRTFIWEAHEALVLKVAWNPNTGLIVSWGEDERYKVWDHDGRQLHISAPRYQNITALAWAADGQLFVMGSYNALILCDKNGWCHSLHRPACGSLLNLAWSNDGSQVAGAGENGHVVIARVIEKWVATPKDEDRLHNCTRIEDPTKDVDFHYLVEKRDDLVRPIPYKTDKQSESGTRATGCKKNHLYMLPVAQRWSEYGQTGRHSFWRYLFGTVKFLILNVKTGDKSKLEAIANPVGQTETTYNSRKDGSIGRDRRASAFTG
ncbi:hypothetical protein HAZT_HAZT008349 [Hyalella azteca]|uniref:Uncharacterized protein n=1 Tax=Hyalella azteca TaxID=294128 RepID=A0A6A0H3Q6_HYAAZ|nr:hypothetical protein HAZT_HAZT008349 [Hyalella azteca]